MGDSLGTSVNMIGEGKTPKYGRPDDLKFEEYARNPSGFDSGIDYDALARQQKTKQALSGGNKMNQLQARYAGAGMRRADVGTGLAEIGADTERAQNDADLAMQQAKFSDQMSLMDAYNRAIERSNAMKKGKYDTDYRSWREEEDRRAGLHSKLGEQQHKLGGSFLSMIGGA